MLSLKKKILIVTDSLGIPRVNPELVVDSLVWTYRIQRAFSDTKIEVNVVTIPGLDTDQLLSWTNDYLMAFENVDLLLLQVGIVDSYPRAISKSELSILLRLPKKISNFTHSMVKKYYTFLTSRRNIRYVPLERFKLNIKEVGSRFPNTTTAYIPVAPANRNAMKKNTILERSISDYNHALKNVFPHGEIKAYDGVDPESIYISDNHHLNSNGHQAIFEKVSSYISNFLGNE